MSVDDVKAGIRQAIAAIEAAEITLTSVEVMAGEALGRAAAATHDSAHAEVRKGLAAVEAARAEVTLVRRRLDSATDSASRYLRGL